MDMAKSNIVEIESFKEKRKAFLEEVKREGEIQLIDITRKEEPKKQQEYKAKKSARENSKEQKRKIARTRFFKKVGVITAMIATSAVLGAIKTYGEHIADKEPATLEQVLEKEKTGESLSISQETIEDIEDMNETLEEDLDYKKMLKVAGKFPDIQMSVLKEKIAMEMGVKTKDITFKPPKDGYSVRVLIKGKGSYETKSPINQKIQGKAISEDIANYIEEIIEAQGKEEALEANIISLEEAKAFYQKAFKRMNQVAVWKIQADEKENISVEEINQLELDNGWEH